MPGRLLQRVSIQGIQFTCALQLLCRPVPVPLPSLNETYQLEHQRIVGQALAGNFQFGQGSVVLAISPIEVLSTRQVCFTCVRPEAKRCLDGGVRQGQSRGCPVETEGIKVGVSGSELTKCLEKRRIVRDR